MPSKGRFGFEHEKTDPTTRREHWRTVGDILDAVAGLSEEPAGRLGVTRVAAVANVAFDGLQPYLAELRDLGMVAEIDPPTVTSAGVEFLVYYRQWNRILERFGLQPHESIVGAT